MSKESSLDILEFDRKLLQISAPYINISLNYLFNDSLNCGFVPNDWKLARTTPVYKGKCDKNNISNYRPISVVCHIAKLLEKEVQSQFVSYLQTNHLTSVDQYAFLPNHSTNTCLHRVIDDWFESFNEKEKFGACFLDISKCFDCIDHEPLLSKLNKYGI